VSVVTGGGKTVFAEMCLLSFFEEHPDGQALVVVPTAALLDQWYTSLQDELGVGTSQLTQLGAGAKPKKTAPITIAIVNSARRLNGQWGQQNSPKMLIVDECHRLGSPENAKALSGEYAATVGLSATPERQYDDGFSSYIAPALGPIIYEYDYVQAHAEGVIAPFALNNVQISMLPDEQAEYERITKRIRGAIAREGVASVAEPSEQLKRLFQQRAAVSATALMRIPVAVRLIEQHRGERAIIFHERTTAADKIFELLRERGHSASVYHAGIGEAIRRENLRLFRRGVHDVLVCCRALDEGMNVPETSVAVIASSTASNRQRIQRLGRILRPAKGKDFATVYTIYATDEERKRLLKEASDLEEVTSVTWHESRRRLDA
jgi:superfamily II DNA or RNA helicase